MIVEAHDSLAQPDSKSHNTSRLPPRGLGCCYLPLPVATLPQPVESCNAKNAFLAVDIVKEQRSIYTIKAAVGIQRILGNFLKSHAL